MATVPRDGFDAALAPASLGRQESIASPELFGAESRRQMEMGAQLVDAGTKLNTVAIKLQEQDNLTAVQAANIKYQEAAQKFQLEAREKRTLNAAAGVTGDFDQFHEKLVKEVGDTLGNDSQKRAFGVMTGKSRLAFRHDLGTFELAEGKKAYAATTDASISQSLNSAATAATDDAARVFIGDAVNSAKAYAAINSYSDVQRDEYVGKVRTNAHKQRIEDLAVRDPARAHEYFKAVEKEIDGAQRAEIGAKAERATSEGIGVAAAEAAWKQFRPTTADAPIPSEKIANAIRESLKGQPEAVKIAGIKKGLEWADRLKADYAQENKQNDEAQVAAVSRLVLEGKSTSAIKSSSEWAILARDNPTAAAKMNEHLISVETTKLNRANAQEQRNQQVLNRTMAGAFLRYSNPDALNAMSEDEITNLVPVLGNDYTVHLMQQKRALIKNPAKIIEARIDQQDFDHVAQEIGLRPFAPNKSEEEKAKLGELKYAVETRINAEQGAAKRQLTRDEKMRLVKETVDNKVMVERFMWPDSQKPAALLAPDEVSKAYVTVKGQEIKLADIPSDFRSGAIAALRKRNVAPTEQAIAGMWAASRKPADAIGGR
ncbi:hypothetical protein UFOVP1326_52 [uncultured Caudovirales phage]|uniref:Uncharacterized protein n=1 Tax=uncultured Caudovirales phage TaxID=2100421 RepID=A0A6J5RQI5_9CAUD|nr:hypothetical protein UFOVP1326_52 [uncultured Caudovirales phage]CAB4212859.1 hypothetical protein UFOVP1436_39 [uncultured Caudovirales phage]